MSGFRSGVDDCVDSMSLSSGASSEETPSLGFTSVREDAELECGIAEGMAKRAVISPSRIRGEADSLPAGNPPAIVGEPSVSGDGGGSKANNFGKESFGKSLNCVAIQTRGKRTIS